MSGAIEVLVLVVGSAIGVVVLVAAVWATRLLVRHDRAGFRERVARPVVDSARVDAALHGVSSASSDQLVAAVEADAAARDRRSSEGP